jgi:predicted nucleotidyltransferase
MHYDEAMNHCIFRFISGSHAYGTNRPDSDTDYRGVFIENYMRNLHYRNHQIERK